MFEIVDNKRFDPKTGKPIEGGSEEIIEHAFMFLSNLTAIEVGQEHVLGVQGDGKFKFIVVESVFGMFCYFSKNVAFDFVANIMSNLACLEAGRNFMIDHKYIEAIVV